MGKLIMNKKTFLIFKTKNNNNTIFIKLNKNNYFPHTNLKILSYSKKNIVIINTNTKKLYKINIPFVNVKKYQPKRKNNDETK
jgi:hypothetical protein